MMLFACAHACESDYENTASVYSINGPAKYFNEETWANRWTCPYCKMEWPEGYMCHNPRCPSKYGHRLTPSELSQAKSLQVWQD
jgi:hypothetical protein